MTRAVVLAAGAGVCAAAALVELAAAGRRRPRTAARDTEGDRRGARARALTAALARVGRRLGVRGSGVDLERRLAAAGAPLGLTVADVTAIKGGAALVGALLAVPMATALPGRLGIVALVSAPLGGYLAPEVVLGRRARARGAQIATEVADVLDLLRVAVQAGLTPGRALAEVGRRRPGLLPAELRAVARRVELGVPRAEALEQLTARCPQPAVRALAAAIVRADRHGAALAGALEALALEARADHARRIRDEAARAAPKIQLVVALVLVPAVMLLVAAALVLALVPPG